MTIEIPAKQVGAELAPEQLHDEINEERQAADGQADDQRELVDGEAADRGGRRHAVTQEEMKHDRREGQSRDEAPSAVSSGSRIISRFSRGH